MVSTTSAAARSAAETTLSENVFLSFPRFLALGPPASLGWPSYTKTLTAPGFA